MTTQETIQSAVCEAIARFQQEYMGRRPQRIRAHLLRDLLVVHIQGILSAAERELVARIEESKGRDLLKRVRKSLIETSRPVIEKMVVDVTGVPVKSLHHDFSTVTDEEVVLFTLAELPAQ